MLRNLRGESYVRRLLAIGAVMVAILAAFALGSNSALPRVSAAPASPGNLVLGVLPPLDGCRLGPALFTFCDQAPGSISEWQLFFVSPKAEVSGVAFSVGPVPGLSANYAAGDFTVTSTPPPQITTNGVPCFGTLQANQACVIFVAFSPTTTGLRQAQITVSDSAGDSLPINVEGTGTQLVFSLPSGIVTSQSCNPTPLIDNAFAFCTAAIGTTSATQEFTLSSGANGSTGVNVALAPIPGLESEFAATDFTIESTTCTGALPANGTCTVGVAFTPTAAGARSAALTATDSSGDSTLIYLSGRTTSGLGFSGIAQPFSANCQIVNSFDYCNLPVGGISSVRTFKFENTSGTQITGLSVPKGSVFAQGGTASDFTVQSTSCSSVLASGAMCNIGVAFTPTVSGLRQGAIVITDAQGDVATLNLAGYGDDYSITTQLPTELSVIPGGTVTFNATLTPDNVFGMNGEQVTFTCPTSLPTDTSCAVTPCPAMITPGTPVSVQMTIITSSAKVITPPLTAGCSSYGPSSAEFISAPPPEHPATPSPGTAVNKSSALYISLIVLAALGAIGLAMAAIAAPAGAASRRRISVLIAGAGLAAAMLAGCHHHGATVTDATPIGETVLTFQGTALDSSGNSLNAARSFQATLDVVTK